MRIPDDTPVRFVPGRRHPDKPAHTGRVAYYTTDCFYRVYWDKPNPDPSFFDLETVYLPEQLERVES